MKCVICDICGAKITLNDTRSKVSLPIRLLGFYPAKAAPCRTMAYGIGQEFGALDLCYQCTNNLAETVYNMTKQQREEELHADR